VFAVGVHVDNLSNCLVIAHFVGLEDVGQSREPNVVSVNLLPVVVHDCSCEVAFVDELYPRLSIPGPKVDSGSLAGLHGSIHSGSSSDGDGFALAELLPIFCGEIGRVGCAGCDEVDAYSDSGLHPEAERVRLGPARSCSLLFVNLHVHLEGVFPVGSVDIGGLVDQNKILSRV
jgi:hypothetical protein